MPQHRLFFYLGLGDKDEFCEVDKPWNGVFQKESKQNFLTQFCPLVGSLFCVDINLKSCKIRFPLKGLVLEWKSI